MGVIIQSVFWGVICYILAKTKNKDGKVAFVIGLLGRQFSVVYYLIIYLGVKIDIDRLKPYWDKAVEEFKETFNIK